MATQTQSQKLSNPGAFYQDGLVDIGLGLVAFFFGAALHVEIFFMAWIAPAALVPTWIMMRNATLRRMRKAGITAQHNSRSGLLLGSIFGLLGVLVLGLFNIGMNSGFRAWLDEYSGLALGGLGIALLIIVGIVLNLRRCYAYAGLALALITAGQLFGLSFPLGITIFGGFVALTGVGLLTRFFRLYPTK